VDGRTNCNRVSLSGWTPGALRRDRSRVRPAQGCVIVTGGGAVAAAKQATSLNPDRVPGGDRPGGCQMGGESGAAGRQRHCPPFAAEDLISRRPPCRPRPHARLRSGAKISETLKWARLREREGKIDQFDPVLLGGLPIELKLLPRSAVRLPRPPEALRKVTRDVVGHLWRQPLARRRKRPQSRAMPAGPPD